ncbi:hypothetical protein GDO81_020490 [Engystomops pustulosus]|uniref:Uncharacterized protein n=1 Tax=Engystomops pustulosus TaxID=76066 RepID=A0AAV6ZQ53_ENGPU|nr:hypothetical protein GDO81_020490 [Engystomops pustulosus]
MLKVYAINQRRPRSRGYIPGGASQLRKPCGAEQRTPRYTRCQELSSISGQDRFCSSYTRNRFWCSSG